MFAVLLDFVLEEQKRQLAQSGVSRMPSDQGIADMAMAFASSDCLDLLLQAAMLPEGFSEAVASRIMASMPSTLHNEVPLFPHLKTP